MLRPMRRVRREMVAFTVAYREARRARAAGASFPEALAEGKHLGEHAARVRDR